MIHELVLLERDSQAARVAKIADLLGIPVKIVSEVPSEPCVVVLAGYLYDEYQTLFAADNHTVFVYDTAASATLRQQLEPFATPVNSVFINNNEADFTAQLTNLAFKPTSPQSVFRNHEPYTPLILADGYAMLVKQGRTYLTATSEIVDIDTPAPRDCEPHRDFFASLIPLVLFLKHAFREQSWHLQTRAACITVDDPLLKPTYGFIEFEAFQKWLRQNQLAATFAFIPWNHHRSNRRVVQLFCENPDTLSICVHGYNHTNREFGETDYHVLHTIATDALRKMRQHQQRYGLAYDEIMIVPQGKFSNEALDVLGEVGYRAMVNSGVYATNYDNSLTLRDVLDLAVVSNTGLPLYRRRYPVDVFDFACDMLLEKPIIITQHHNDFREGTIRLQNFTAQLQQIEPRLQWMPLGQLVTASQWQKMGADGRVQKRRLDNVAQAYQPLTLHPMFEAPVLERSKVALRRYLSEFRDNVVHTNPLLHKIVRRIRS